jgi:glutathione synthase/RimK-type ligase-like ATP-grasp enzyme
MNVLSGASTHLSSATESREQAEPETANPKVLVIATQKTVLAARMSMALSDAGFAVAALAPYGHPVRRLRVIQNHFAYGPRPRLKSILRAILRWSPSLLVCTDDLAVTELQDLYQHTAFDNERRHISELIELSLGPASSFAATRKKSEFLTLAKAEGLRAPRTVVLSAGATFDSVPAELIFPIIVKADHSYGGICVRFVTSKADVRPTIWELQTPNKWRNIFRRFFGAALGSKALDRAMLRLRRTISIQQYIQGRPSNRAVVCWKGKVLGGISVEAVEVTHENGPASVVRFIDHPEMAIAVEHMVKRLNLSGFVGFDFVLDTSNEAWIIELNPRVTPICHFPLADGTDLVGSLYTQMTGFRRPSRDPAVKPRLVALFPNEIIRSPRSEYLNSCQHDVPWKEPELVSWALQEMLQMGIRKRLRIFLERYLPVAVGVLVRCGLVEPRR